MLWRFVKEALVTKRVLIVTESSDIHADHVFDRIAEKGLSPFRLDLDAFPRDFDLSLHFSAGRWSGGMTHRPTNDHLPIADIGSVWMRKKAPFRYRSDDLATQEKAFADGEMEHILFSLLYGLDCYWMSHPVALRGAGWKGEQLLRAARLGFDVPDSLITSVRQDVDNFQQIHTGGIIYKTLSSPILAADEVDPEDRIAGHLSTTLITEDDEDLLDSVFELPSLFQPNVPKAYELRVTVIGDRVFAARIDSQDDSRTFIDSRDMSAEIPYQVADLPQHVAQRCLDFVHSYGLTFGAIDLIFTPDGRYVFLENNPVGQFLFVEQLVPELDMTGHVAQVLVNGARSANS